MSVHVGEAEKAPEFPSAARQLLSNTQLRYNVRRATDIIRAKRAKVVGELPDWEALRDSAREIKRHVLRHLDEYLEQFETACTRAGGHVHWARDADEANRIIIGIIQSHGANEVIKVKTMTSDETRLNVALEAAGITPYETDLADLIIQLGKDKPSHIVVPALHKNRSEIRELFMDTMKIEDLGHLPRDLADAARGYLREKFLRVKVGFSGANFAIAETGSVCVVESEGNGRMCVTLPEVLITQVGIEKIIPRFQDLEVFLQAAAAFGDRRADESLQLDLDRRRPRRRTSRVPRRAARQRPHESTGRRSRPRDPALHPLRRLPQHLPCLPADRRPRLRLDLQRSYRRHSHPAAAVDGALAIAALRLVALRRVLRSVPGARSTSRRSSFTSGGVS